MPFPPPPPPAKPLVSPPRYFLGNPPYQNVDRLQVVGFETGGGIETWRTINMVANTGIPGLAGSPNLATVQTQYVLGGDYSLRCNPPAGGTAYAYVAGSTTSGGFASLATQNYWVKFRFQANVLPTFLDEEICSAYDNATGAFKWGLRIDPNGFLNLYDENNNLAGTSKVQLQAKTTYCIELTEYRTAEGFHTRFELRVTPGTTTGLTTTTSEFVITTGLAPSSLFGFNLGFLGFGVVNIRNGNPVDFIFDDIIIDGFNWVGVNSEVVALQVTGNGTYTGWNLGTGASDWTQLLTNDGDGSYIQSATAGEVATFKCGGELITGPVYCLSPIIIAEVLGGGSIGMRFRSGTTDRDLVPASIGMGYQVMSGPFSWDINTGNSQNAVPGVVSGWDASSASLCEVGVVNVSAGWARVTYAAIMAEIATGHITGHGGAALGRQGATGKAMANYLVHAAMFREFQVAHFKYQDQEKAVELKELLEWEQLDNRFLF